MLSRSLITSVIRIQAATCRSNISSRRFVFTKTQFVKEKNTREVGFGWFLLLIPVTTFGLGTWQVQRKKWKEGLILELKRRTQSAPIELPNNLEDIEKLEYYPVHVRGRFQHEKEMYMGPRSLLSEGDSMSQSSLITQGRMESSTGYLVVTPFTLSNSNVTILVNRGWVPVKKLNPETRKEGQVTGEVDLFGIVRLDEKRPNFVPRNQPGKNTWFFRDLEQMSQIANSSPIFIDLINDGDVPNGPIGGQTRISLRNEHLSYILTWYSLSAFTGIMWYRYFLRGKPLI